MNETLTNRIAKLEQSLAAGSQQLQQLDRQREQLRQQLLRVDGALAELMSVQDELKNANESNPQ